MEKSTDVYLDSGNRFEDNPKDYTHIRTVVNDAINGYARKGGRMKRTKKNNSRFEFFHKVYFPCIKQDLGS